MYAQCKILWHIQISRSGVNQYTYIIEFIFGCRTCSGGHHIQKIQIHYDVHVLFQMILRGQQRFLVLPSYMKWYHKSKYTTIPCMQNVMHHEHFSFPVDLIPALIPLNVALPYTFNIFLIHSYTYNSTIIYVLNSKYLYCTCNQKFAIYILSYIPNMFILFINSNVLGFSCN